MKHKNKLIIWITGSAAFLAALLALLLLLSPLLLNAAPVKKRLMSFLSARVGGAVRYQSLEVSFFPRPKVVVTGAGVDIPKGVSGTLDTAVFYPRLRALFFGKLHMEELRIKNPELVIGLKNIPKGLRGTQEKFMGAALRKWIAPVLGFLSRSSSLVAEKGRLALGSKKSPVFEFRDIRILGRSTEKGFDIGVTCDSNLWERLSLEGRLNPGKAEAKARIRIERFRPHELSDYFFPRVCPALVDSKADLNVLLGIKEESVQADIRGSLLCLTLGAGGEETDINIPSFELAFQGNGERWRMSLSETELGPYAARVSGNLATDKNNPDMVLEVECRDVNISSVRGAALELAGKYRIVDKMFGILKGGTVPLLKSSARGESAAEMFKLENISLRGNIKEGRVQVPRPLLDLRLVEGNVSLSRGTLKGERLKARRGNTRGRDGQLKIGFTGKKSPFYLDIKIDADLQELPPVLEELVKSRPFQREMGLIKDVKGRAAGRLVLEREKGDMKVEAETREMDFFLEYARLPFPLDIKGGLFTYNAKEIEVKDLRGEIGNSSFCGLQASLNGKAYSSLEVTSGKAVISISEFFPWIQALPGTREDLTLGGRRIAVSEASLRGPLLEPEKWNFRVKGEASDIFIGLPGFPAPVEFEQGGFTALPGKLFLDQCRSRFLDAALEISGTVDNYLYSLRGLELSINGNAGDKAVRWFLKKVSFPRAFSPRTPISFKGARLLWNNKGPVSFSSAVGFSKKQNVYLDIAFRGKGSWFAGFSLKDDGANAFLEVGLADNDLNLSFKGKIKAETLDQILAENSVLDGWIEGEFRARVPLDRPLESTANGRIEAGDICRLWKWKLPAGIAKASLLAAGNDIWVEYADLDWKECPLHIKGIASLSKKGILADMDVVAGSLDWESIKGIADIENREGADGFPGLPLQGVLRVKAGNFRYDDYNWRDIQAELSITGRDIRVDVKKATLCGISFAGDADYSAGEVDVGLRLCAIEQDLNNTLDCLWGKKDMIKGKFNLEGSVEGKAIGNQVYPSLQGKLKFTAKEGRIYRMNLLARILAMLNITEILRGRAPDLSGEGLAFYSMEGEGALEKGKLHIQNFIIDGSSMDIVCNGYIDMVKKDMDLDVLVAPLKTVDFIVGNIPLLGYVLGGHLVSVPVKVRGSPENPEVIPLSPATMGKELLGILERILHLPVKIIQPLLPKEEKKEK